LGGGGSGNGDSDAVGVPGGGIEDVRERTSFTEDDKRLRCGGAGCSDDHIIIAVVVDVSSGASVGAKEIGRSRRGNFLDILARAHGCEINCSKCGGCGPAHNYRYDTSLICSSDKVSVPIFVEVADKSKIVPGSTSRHRTDHPDTTSRHEGGEINGGSASFHRLEEKATSGDGDEKT